MLKDVVNCLLGDDKYSLYTLSLALILAVGLCLRIWHQRTFDNIVDEILKDEGVFSIAEWDLIDHGSTDVYFLFFNNKHHGPFG